VCAKSKDSPNVRRLLIKVLEVFEAFRQTAYGIFLCANLQIAYKYCVNFAKTEFPYRI